MVRDLWHVGEQLGGFKQGETLCHITYLDMSCSLVCMKHTRATTGPGIVVSRSLGNVKGFPRG